jgi:hypothetical protein
MAWLVFPAHLFAWHVFGRGVTLHAIPAQTAARQLTRYGSAFQGQAPAEGFLPAGHATAGPAGDMAAAHGSFTMHLADGRHPQHNGFEQQAAMTYTQQHDHLTHEQLAAAYAASQAGFDPQAAFDPNALAHHQMQAGVNSPHSIC